MPKRPSGKSNVSGAIYNIGLYNLGYWHQRADEGHGNPPQGNQELLVVRDKVERPPGELGVSKSMECDIFPFSAFDTVDWATETASGL